MEPASHPAHAGKMTTTPPDVDPKRGDQEVQLESMDVEQSSGDKSLDRYINLSSISSFGLLILASWESFAVSFQLAVQNGGPASIFYGSIFGTVGTVITALSLAELASIDPTVGAQYRWSANLAPSHPRFWGLMQGWITVASWVFSTAAPVSITANLITSLATLNHASYALQPWHTSLLMMALALAAILSNLWFKRLVDALEAGAGVLHLGLFVVFIGVFVALGERNDAEFVFATLVHGQEGGWRDPGVAWCVGILTMTFSLSGVDSVIHMSDEVKKVHTRVPRSMILAAASNGIMLIVFAVVFLLYGGPLLEPDTSSSSSSALPIVDVVYRTTGSRPATTALVSLLVLVFFAATFNMFASVSRLVWAFSRDQGLPFSGFFAYVHPTLHLPTNAFVLIGSTTTLLSLIYMGSATAYNALISLTSLGITLSYLAPVAFLLLRRLRTTSTPFGPFSLGRWGVPCNVATLCYLLFVAVWMPFPAGVPVTAASMNYAGPIFGAAVLLALGDWVMGGRKRFRLPVKRYE